MQVYFDSFDQTLPSHCTADTSFTGGLTFTAPLRYVVNGSPLQTEVYVCVMVS